MMRMLNGTSKVVTLKGFVTVERAAFSIVKCIWTTLISQNT